MYTTYSGLFEDELTELFRNMSKGDCIIYGNTEYHVKPGISFDGLFTTDNDLFLVIENNSRSYVNTAYLISILAHKDFTVKRGNW